MIKLESPDIFQNQHQWRKNNFKIRSQSIPVDKIPINMNSQSKITKQMKKEIVNKTETTNY